VSNHGCTPSIFVVDDSGVVRENIVKRLKKEDFVVRSFESGERVLEALTRDLPDLVFLDLHMPRLSGIDTIGEMQKRGISVPVVLLTAHQELVDMAKVKYKGVLSLVTKSLDLQDVVSVAKLAIAGRRSLIL